MPAFKITFQSPRTSKGKPGARFHALVCASTMADARRMARDELVRGSRPVGVRRSAHGTRLISVTSHRDVTKKCQRDARLEYIDGAGILGGARRARAKR